MAFRAYLSQRFDRETRRDVARISLQTLVASGATYGVITALDWPHVSWAVISAIFVIQLNSDSSIVTGIGRIFGTAMGTLFGLVATQIMPGFDAALLRVALTTAIASGIATIWPNLSYGAVAAAAVVVQGHPDLIDAVEQAVAICIGAVVGTAATLFVWPELGRNRVLRMLEYALDDCRENLEQVLAQPGEASRKQRQAIHEHFIGHMATARGVLQDTRIGTRLKNGCPLRDLLGAVERLWYGLVMLDRTIGHEQIDLTQTDQERLRGHISTVQVEAQSFLKEMVVFLHDGEPFPQARKLQQTIADAREAAEAELGETGESVRRGRTLRVLLFALEEVSDNLSDLEAFARTRHETPS